MLLLPGDPEFDQTLGVSLPPGWEQERDRNSGEYAFVADAETGILRPCSAQELEEYLEGGEYEARLRAMGDDEALGEFLGEFA